jgi:hypothetical protein
MGLLPGVMASPGKAIARTGTIPCRTGEKKKSLRRGIFFSFPVIMLDHSMNIDLHLTGNMQE